jgi:cell division protein FtsA
MNLAKTKGGLVAALDIGCSKVCCFIARTDDGDRPRVIGIGQQASRGIKNGTVVDMAGAEAAILNAVHAAELMAGETIDRVIVSLAGGHPASSSVGVQIALNGHEVGDADLRRAFDHCHQTYGLNGDNGGDRGAAVQAGPGRQMIHSIPTAYTIDGNRGVRDPRGMCGDRLGVNIHFVTAATSAVRNLTTCIRRCHLDVAGYVVAPFASGLASLADDELELGVTVIDMGGGITSIAVFYEGSVVFTDVVPVGGNHVTKDIARGLSTTLVHAERLKTLYGHAMTTDADAHEMIDVPQVGEDDETNARQVPRSLLVGIVQPRLEETFELVRSRLEASGFDKLGGRRVVLTGGASLLPGMRELGGLILDKQLRVGRPTRVRGLAEATAGPAYATCAGLLIHGATEDRAAPGKSPAMSQAPESLFGRVGHWLREHF